MFVLNIMVNEFTCNHIVRGDSIMIVSISWKKKKKKKKKTPIQLKLGGIISCHIFVISYWIWLFSMG